MTAVFEIRKNPKRRIGAFILIVFEKARPFSSVGIGTFKSARLFPSVGIGTFKSNRYKPLLISICCALMPAPAFSEIDPVGRTASDLIYEKDPLTKKTKKPFSLNTGLEYINGFIVSADRVSRLFAVGSYRFSESLSLSLAQNLNQHYIRNPNSNDTGLWIQDTLISLQHSFKTPWKQSNMTGGLTATLPVSYYSRVNDIYTLGTAYLVWSLKLDSFLKRRPKRVKNITFSLKPVARYYFSEYTTTPTKGQSAGGTPLSQFLFGLQTAGLSMDIADRFSLSGGYGQWAVSVYDISPAIVARDPNYKKRLKHFYIISLAGVFKINKQWKLSLSYSHGERLDQQGRVETVGFDKWVSAWSVSLSHSFSFETIKIRPTTQKKKKKRKKG